MPMNKKEFLEIPLSDLVGDSSLPDPVTYQYYKNLKNRKMAEETREIVVCPAFNSDLLLTENIAYPDTYMLCKITSKGYGFHIDVPKYPVPPASDICRRWTASRQSPDMCGHIPMI